MNGTYTFNKGNWSGEEATITVKENKFEYYGYNFELVPNTWEFDGEEHTDFLVHGDAWDEPLYTVRDFGDGTYWCSSAGIERTNTNPFILAAIMASNTI